MRIGLTSILLVACLMVFSQDTTRQGVVPYLGLDNNFNRGDYLIGGVFGIAEQKVKLDFYFSIVGRPKAKKVLVQQSDDLYYQYRENKVMVQLGAAKWFSLLYREAMRVNVFIGVKGIMDASNYRGTSKGHGLMYRLSSGTGLFWSWKSLGLKLNYEYLDFNKFDVSPHRVNIGLMVMFNEFITLPEGDSDYDDDENY